MASHQKAEGVGHTRRASQASESRWWEDLVQSMGSYALGEGAANPLPQALVLTAIVIGFALLALAAIVAYEATRALGTVNADEMTAARDEGDPFQSETGEGSSAR